jgi:hypothetical protein
LVSSETISMVSKIEQPTTKISFDETLAFSESDKYDKIIRISKGEGIGLINNDISIFKIFNKKDGEVISNYSFKFPMNTVPNMIIGLKKLYNN